MARQTGIVSSERPDRIPKDRLQAERVFERQKPEDLLGGRFFRHLVFNLRSGVLASTRDAAGKV